MIHRPEFGPGACDTEWIDCEPSYPHASGRREVFKYVHCYACNQGMIHYPSEMLEAGICLKCAEGLDEEGLGTLRAIIQEPLRRSKERR